MDGNTSESTTEVLVVSGVDVISISFDELIGALYSDAITNGPLTDGALKALERLRCHFGYEAVLWWDGRAIVTAAGEQHEHSFPFKTVGEVLARWDGVSMSPRRWDFVGKITNRAESVHRFAFYPGRAASAASDEVQPALYHFLCACDIAQRLKAPVEAPPAPRMVEELGNARVAAKGRIVTADARFAELVRGIDKTWDGTTLPFVIRWGPRLMAHGHVWKSLFFRVSRLGDDVYDVQVRRNLRMPSITAREWAVAERVARGMTYKEIAREMDVAASTVSSHVYTIYDKIGVRRRSELVEWLARHPTGTTTPQR